MDEFPWLGYRFNTRNLNVHLDLANATYLGMSYMNTYTPPLMK